jgi:hypothetical protein
METVQERLPGVGIIVKIIFVILALVVLYYTYRFFFTANGLEGKTLISSVKPANTASSSAYISAGDSLPAIYEGGEVTLNGWIYINDYAIQRGLNKHVFSLGGDGFLTLAVYLGPYKNSLQVRVTTEDTPATNSPLKISSLGGTSGLFTSSTTDSSLTDTSNPCDISSIDLQKWVQVTVALSNKICDVYIDGKLARSCILPSFYRVDRNNFKFSSCDYKGFGGFVSNTSVYNYALNPEQVWKLYMAGPGPQYGLLDYFKSLFDPKAVSALEFPKMQ